MKGIFLDGLLDLAGVFGIRVLWLGDGTGWELTGVFDDLFHFLFYFREAMVLWDWFL